MMVQPQSKYIHTASFNNIIIKLKIKRNYVFLFFFFKIYFILKFYIIVLVLPNIKMNPPQVYMCSPFNKICVDISCIKEKKSQWKLCIAE